MRQPLEISLRVMIGSGLAVALLVTAPLAGQPAKGGGRGAAGPDATAARSGEPLLARYSATLTFDVEGLDLETGDVVARLVPGSERDLADIYLSYNAERGNPVVLFHNARAGVRIAFLDGVSFAYVDGAVAADAEPSGDLVDRPLEPNDTVIVATPEGALFKVGNAMGQGGGTVTVEVERLW